MSEVAENLAEIIGRIGTAHTMKSHYAGGSIIAVLWSGGDDVNIGL